MIRHRLLILIALTLAALCSAVHAQDAVYDVSARGDRLWLVRVNTAGFDVFTRKAAADWKPIGRGYSGAVLLTLAGEEQLHVVFAERQFATINLDGELLPSTRLPAEPLAACYLPAAEEGKQPSLLMLARTKADQTNDSAAATQPADATATTAPATQPATQPARAIIKSLTPSAVSRQHVSLFRLEGNAWQPLASVPADTAATSSRRWSIAAWQGRVYVVQGHDDDHASDLLSIYDLENEAWQPATNLPDAHTTIHTVGDKLVAVGRAGSTADAGRKHLNLRTWDADAGWSEPQTIRRDSEPMNWPSMPHVTAAGERLIFLWRSDAKDGEGRDILLATCGLDGALLPPEAVSRSIESIPDTTLVDEVRQKYILGLLVLLLVVAVVLRPRERSRLFVLPPMLIPGSLPKRALAAMIDFGPFLFAAGLYLQLTHTPSQMQTFMADPTAITLGMTIAGLATMTSYVAYGAVCELLFGMTVGKKLMRLRVVGNGGRKPDLRDVLLRNILKIFELSTLGGPLWWFFGFLVALPLFTRYRQRLGDIMGRTAVVEARAIRLPSGAVARLESDELPTLKDISPEDAERIPPELRADDDEQAEQKNGDTPESPDERE